MLEGESTLMLRRQALREKSRAKTRSKVGLSRAATTAGNHLFEALRAWRDELARTQGLPAYVILHDKTLHELATRGPQRMDELLDVAGIGEAKAVRYGAALLELLAAP